MPTKEEQKKKTTTKSTVAKKPATNSATKKSTAKTATKKPAAKKTTKAASKKPTTKKPASTKVVTKEKRIEVVQKHNDTDNLLDILSQTQTEQKPVPAPKKTKPTTSKKTQAKKTKPVPVQPKVKHRTKLTTKEEKQLFKRLSDAFNYVANLTMVIEERTMDKEAISDLTIGEIHVLEVVNQQAEMPMTKVANQLKITVGSLTTCVNRLVKKEYLSRVRDDVDHRVIKVSTTLKAKKVLKSHDAFHEEILLSVLDGITIKDATKVMEQFERTLENYYNPKEKNYEAPVTTTKKKK